MSALARGCGCARARACMHARVAGQAPAGHSEKSDNVLFYSLDRRLPVIVKCFARRHLPVMNFGIMGAEGEVRARTHTYTNRRRRRHHHHHHHHHHRTIFLTPISMSSSPTLSILHALSSFVLLFLDCSSSSSNTTRSLPLPPFSSSPLLPFTIARPLSFNCSLTISARAPRAQTPTRTDIPLRLIAAYCSVARAYCGRLAVRPLCGLLLLIAVSRGLIAAASQCDPFVAYCCLLQCREGLLQPPRSATPSWCCISFPPSPRSSPPAAPPPAPPRHGLPDHNTHTLQPTTQNDGNGGAARVNREGCVCNGGECWDGADDDAQQTPAAITSTAKPLPLCCPRS